MRPGKDRRFLPVLLVVSVPFLLVQLQRYLSVLPDDGDLVHGFVNESFLGVYDVFRENFLYGLERDGASISVYHKGEQVVHLWGGLSNRKENKTWNVNTRSAYFSMTKAISALCVAMLVDKGMLEYGDLVTKYWPEYGQAGKNRTTIEDVLTHKAGLPYIDDDISMEDVEYPEIWMEKFEKAKPIWEPGTATGYHPVTFGFLADGIVRKVTGRGIQQFFQEELGRKYGLNIRIGNSPREAHHVARISQPSMEEYLRAIVYDPRMVVMLSFLFVRPFDSVIDKIRSNPSWLVMEYEKIALNDPEVLKLNLPAVTGVGTADALARLFSLAIDGTLLSKSTLEQLAHPTVDDWHFERTVVWPVMKGHGFFYEPHPFISGAYLFGHPGYGGQQLVVDPNTGTTIVYVSNGLKTGSGLLCNTYMRLLDATYKYVTFPSYATFLAYGLSVKSLQAIRV
ncbi:unnamed protein product, partial [Mesorhabditis spiculigera]